MAKDSAPAAAAPWRLRCMCGTLLEIDPQDEGKRQTCETCRRRFDVRFTEDEFTGRKGVSLLYLTDENQKNGSSSTVGAGTTIVRVGSGARSPQKDGPDVEPELPDEAHFKCACGILLVLGRKNYEKRVRCPACNARMLAFLLYNASSNSFNLQLFNLIDKSTGSTQILPRL